MPGVSIKNFALASGVVYNNGLPYNSSGALLVDGSTVESVTLSSLPAASSVPGLTVLISNVGPSGALFFSNGVSWRPVGGSCYLDVLANEVTNNGAPEVISKATLIPAGFLLDNDRLEIGYSKSRTGTDTDTVKLRLGTAAGTLGTDLTLTTAALAGATISMSVRAALKKMSATSLKPISILGSLGFGGSTSTLAAVTVPNMNTQDTYLQITSDLTTAAGDVSTLTDYTVRLIAGS